MAGIGGASTPRSTLGSLRSSLQAVLRRAVYASGARVWLGTTVLKIENQPGGTLRRYDLIVGADGIYSSMRRLIGICAALGRGGDARAGGGVRRDLGHDPRWAGRRRDRQLPVDRVDPAGAAVAPGPGDRHRGRGTRVPAADRPGRRMSRTVCALQQPA
jgi:2-polyprenyl-6-methoxyphenol hydroxylase-like FAD-dependent oxidoreductase